MKWWGNQCHWPCKSCQNVPRPSVKFWLLVGFVALRPKSTAMVIAGRSVHLTTHFPGQAWTSGWPVIFAHTFACNWQQPFLNESAEGRRMTVEIISWSISTKVWDRAGIELATPGSAVRHASVARLEFERLLIGYISKCKDRLSISIVASISQPYWIINISIGKIQNQSIILGKPRHVLVFQAEQADDSTLGPKQGGGDSEKT